MSNKTIMSCMQYQIIYTADSQIFTIKITYRQFRPTSIKISNFKVKWLPINPTIHSHWIIAPLRNYVDEIHKQQNEMYKCK